MRIKLDENLGQRAAEASRAAGHDVATVYEQRLTSATDQHLLSVCVRQQRLLVSLDIDFANPLRFDALKSAGIAVLRVRNEPTRSELDESIETLLHTLEHADPAAHLWVVRGRRVREYKPRDEEGPDRRDW